ncbi:MAG: hypothetical protein A2599_01210 [Candidatus Staskawiczbacteria bacterium RIFOXYD1_FULL_39_28]|nr:MAG: hypothetical protein A2599_01210 [Candidatus Staskawiczbacteria bacterium RIFOXYD1_FULL_39_28]
MSQRIRSGIKIGLLFAFISLIFYFLGMILRFRVMLISYELDGLLEALLSYVFLLPSSLLSRVFGSSVSTVILKNIFFIEINLFIFFIIGFVVGLIKNNREISSRIIIVRTILFFVAFPIILAIASSVLMGKCDIPSRGYNRNNCYENAAIEQANVEICKKISDGMSTIKRDDCVYRIAKQKNDINLCGEIIREEIKLGCVAFLKNDIKYCDSIQNWSDKQNCYIYAD